MSRIHAAMPERSLAFLLLLVDFIARDEGGGPERSEIGEQALRAFPRCRIGDDERAISIDRGLSDGETGSVSASSQDRRVQSRADQPAMVAAFPDRSELSRRRTATVRDRKSTRLNSSHRCISYA